MNIIGANAGLKFAASTAQLMMIGVPIEHEHWLAECHHRIVTGQAEPEAVRQMRDKLAAAGYFPAPDT
jgi:hypothetical protein